MVQVFLAPKEFLAIDLTTSIIVAIVTALLSIYIYKIYHFTKEGKHKFMSVAFGLISLSFLTKLATTFAYYDGLIERNLDGLANLTFSVIHAPTLVYLGGILIFRFLMLAGFLAILFSIEGINNKRIIGITYILLGMATVFSAIQYYIFYIISTLLLFLITLRFLNNYFENPNRKAKTLTAGFFLLLLAQGCYLASILKPIYKLSGLIELLGFILILITYSLLRKKW